VHDRLDATSSEFGFQVGEQGEVLAVLGPLKTDIVELDSSQVGTPLPAAYQAAPALAR